MTCPTCGEREGEHGTHHPVGQPLGPLRVCPDCGRQVCPVCYDKYLCCDKEATSE
jgi:hypothetical protein